MFKLIGFYLNESQANYIITIFSEVNQVFNTLEVECLDENSNYITHFGIHLYPSFLLLKDNKLIDIFPGKRPGHEVIEWIKKYPAVE